MAHILSLKHSTLGITFVHLVASKRTDNQARYSISSRVEQMPTRKASILRQKNDCSWSIAHNLLAESSYIKSPLFLFIGYIKPTEIDHIFHEMISCQNTSLYLRTLKLLIALDQLHFRSGKTKNFILPYYITPNEIYNLKIKNAAITY